MSTLSLRKIKHDSSAVDNITLGSNGRVGVNVAVPAAQLDVDSELYITEASAAGSSTQLTMFSKHSDSQRGYVILKTESTSSGSSDFVIRSRNNFTENEKFRIDSVGRVLTPYRPAFHAKKDNSNVGPNTAFTSWNNVVTNIGNHFNSTNGTFTAPVSGMYQFNFSGISDNSNASMYLAVGGIQRAWTYGFGTGSYFNLSFSVAVYMAANDSAQLSTSSGTVYAQGDGGAARFSGFLVG